MLTQMGKKAKAAARVLSTAPARLKNAALLGMADALCGKALLFCRPTKWIWRPAAQPA